MEWQMRFRCRSRAVPSAYNANFGSRFSGRNHAGTSINVLFQYNTLLSTIFLICMKPASRFAGLSCVSLFSCVSLSVMGNVFHGRVFSQDTCTLQTC